MFFIASALDHFRIEQETSLAGLVTRFVRASEVNGRRLDAVAPSHADGSNLLNEAVQEFTDV